MTSKLVNTDAIILIGKSKYNGIKLLLAKDLTNNIKHLEKDFYIIHYYAEFKILDYCDYRRLYAVPLFKDLSNLIVKYDSKDFVNEFGLINEDSLYLPLYRKYSASDINTEISKFVSEFTDYFIKTFISKTSNNKVYSFQQEYFYDGEAVDINIAYAIEKDKLYLIEHNQDSNHMGNYSTRIHLTKDLKNRLATFLFSIKKDDIVCAYPTLKAIVTGIFNKLKSFSWENHILLTNDFFIQEPNEYD